MRRMSLGDYPRVTIAKARDAARDALDIAEKGKNPAVERKAEAVARNERTFEAVAERFETVSTDVVWFQQHLSGGPGDDLLAADLASLQTRMERLAARPDRAALLPEVSPRWRELTGRGFGTVLRELAHQPVLGHGEPVGEVRVLDLTGQAPA